MANFIVDSLADISADDGVTTLREAIALANADADLDTITFAAGLTGGVVTLGGSELILTSGMTIDGDIDGDGKADITIDGNDASQVLSVSDGTSTLQSLTITGGDAGFGIGGGIYVGLDATVTLAQSTVAGNYGSLGGGIASVGALNVIGSTIANNDGFIGGGLYIGGTATLTNTTVSGNSVGLDGAGISTGLTSSVDLVNTTVTGNTAADGTGGLYIQGTATLTNMIVLGNGNTSGAGEIVGGYSDLGGNVLSGAAGDIFAALDGAGGGALADNGGAVETVALKADAANTALDIGVDTAASALDANGSARFDLYGFGNEGNNFSDAGAVELVFDPGALVVTTLADVVNPFDGLVSLREAIEFADRTAGADTITFDAGLSSGTITLAGSAGGPGLSLTTDLTIDGDIDGDGQADITIDANDVGRVISIDGGAATLNGLVITGGNGISKGGGIDVVSGDLVLTNSAVTNNKAESGTGGGVYVSVSGTADITNSDISTNQASSGGGIYGALGSVITITDTTLDGNQAAVRGGGVYSRGTLTVYDSTFSDNSTLVSTGGGLANLGTATLVGVTFGGNQAQTTGGAIYNTGTLGLTNGTVTGNQAGTDGAGLWSSAGTTLTNTIISGNGVGSGISEISGTPVYGAGNVIGVAAGTVFAALDGTGGGLLADNGGPVQTVALLADAANVALDAGDDSAAPALDARGNTRADAGGVANNGSNISDSGAFELTDVGPALIDPGPLSLVENAVVVVDLGASDDLSTEGDGLTYAISGGVDAAVFVVDPATGVLGFVAPPDFETPLDQGADNIYAVEVTVTDASGFSDALSLTVQVMDVAEIVIGSGGPDTIDGTSGADSIFGRGGSDVITTYDGDDTVKGNKGGDDIFGGKDNDTLLGDTGWDDVYGGGDADMLFGGNGNDNLYGDAGADQLFGDRDRDELFGGGGTDTLTGGTGKDRLTGDGGADVFAFADGDTGVISSERDVIVDFEAGADMIDLSLFDADAATSGDQVFGFGGTVAAAQSVWYFNAGANVIVAGDVTGDGVADFQISLLNTGSVAAGDFIL